VKLFSKNSNACDHNPPTLQTDGQTDGQLIMAIPRYATLRAVKYFRPVYDHLNALQFLISVYQRCSVTFKMHQIHIRPGLRPRRTLGSSPHSLVGWDLGQGGAACLPGAPQTLASPLMCTFVTRGSVNTKTYLSEHGRYSFSVKS